MPRKQLIILIVLVLVILSGLGYLLLNNKTEETMSASEPLTDSTQTASAGQYVDYSPEVFANSQGQRILFFHAPWCPQCRQLEASIKQGEIPSGVTIFKVDYDSNQKLRQEYGVTIQTSLVLVDENGNEVKKYVAYDTPSLDAVKENLL